MVRAKKHLGQHFLSDSHYAEKVGKACTRIPTDTLLEIGPGTGALTRYLIDSGKNLLCYDVDRESVEYLKEHYPSHNTSFQLKDFLKADLQTDFELKPFAVVGNFPYIISTQIVFKILSTKEQIPYMVGMFQKEVAERICAVHGNKTYGILSVLTQAFYDTSYLFSVPPGAFTPPPKVDSGVMMLSPKTNPFEIESQSGLTKMVKAAFNQRRKTLRNALKGMVTSEFIAANAETFTKRAEQLSVEEFVRLSNSWERNEY